MKISVVTFNRNDGYKENERLLIHLKTLLDTFDEINYVDWNSPNGSSLYNIINDLPRTGKLKHYVIPPSIHYAIVGDRNVSKCLGNFAFNIALRRSSSDWMVCTTIDNIPPLRSELLNFINDADPSTFYTFSRRDIVYSDVVNNIDRLTPYRMELAKLTSPRYFYAKVTPNDSYSIINCCGDFQLAPTKMWMDIRGLEEQMIYNCYVDTNVQKKAILHGYKVQAVFDVPIYHMSHKNILPQESTSEKHEVADIQPPIYNDVYEWVDDFTESQNTDTWGFADTEIEYEII